MTISVDALQRELPDVLRKVAAGETVIVTSAEKAVAEIKPPAAPTRAQELRPFGLAKGEFVVPDDFDDPLPEEILRDFEGA